MDRLHNSYELYANSILTFNDHLKLAVHMKLMWMGPDVHITIHSPWHRNYARSWWVLLLVNKARLFSVHRFDLVYKEFFLDSCSEWFTHVLQGGFIVTIAIVTAASEVILKVMCNIERAKIQQTSTKGEQCVLLLPRTAFSSW